MKKAEQKELAKKVVKRIDELKIKVEIVNGWVVISEPAKAPADLFVDLSQCGKEVADIYRNRVKVNENR